MYCHERLREIANEVLNVYLLQIVAYNQLFQQKLFITKIIQISSTIVLSQVSICQCLQFISSYQCLLSFLKIIWSFCTSWRSFSSGNTQLLPSLSILFKWDTRQVVSMLPIIPEQWDKTKDHWEAELWRIMTQKLNNTL